MDLKNVICLIELVVLFDRNSVGMGTFTSWNIEFERPPNEHRPLKFDD
jgi:hypothetical protein